MTKILEAVLLKDKDVVVEIEKHKWIESEKVGHDIGHERASRDWINACADQFLSERPGKKAVLVAKSHPVYVFLNKPL